MSEQMVFGIRIDGIDGTIRTQKDLTEAIKATKKELGSKEFDSPEYKKLEKRLGSLTSAQQTFRNNARTATKEAAAGANSTEGAYRKLSAQLALSRDRMKDMAAAGQTNSKEFRELNKEVSKLDAELKRIDANAGQFQRNVGNYTSAFSGLANFFTGGLLVGGIAAVAKGLFDLGKKAVEAADIQEKAVAKVANLVKQTGEAAGFTTSELEKMASELQKNSLFGDEEILNKVTAQLLTFSNVAGSEFQRAQQAALDLSTVLDGDLQGASLQLGKALNDPIKGMTALSRSGVAFTDEQKKMVHQLVESNDVIGAQNIILSEVERQYGGAAKAASEAGLGGFQQLKNAFSDLLEPMGRAIIDLGDTLLPILKLIPGLIENAFGIIKRVFQPVIDSAKQLASRFEETTDWTGILTKAIEILTLPIKTFGVVLGGIIDFVDALIVSYQNAQKESEEFSEASVSVVNFFKSLLNAVLQIPAALNGVMRALGQLMNNIKNFDFSGSIIGAFKEGFDEYKQREAGKQGEDIGDEVAKGTAKKMGGSLKSELDKNKNEIKDAGKKGIGEPLVEGSIAAMKALVSELQKELANINPADQKKFQKAFIDLEAAKKEVDEYEAYIKMLSERMKNQGQPLTVGMLGVDALGAQSGPAYKAIDDLAAYAEQKNKETLEKLLRESALTWQDIANITIDALDLMANAALAIEGNMIEKRAQIRIDELDRETRERLRGVEKGSAEENAILQEQKDKQAEIEAQARKKQQELDIKQAIINGALAISRTFANLGFPAAVIPAAFVAAQTAAQIGVIRSQGFAEGGFTGYGGKYQEAGTVHRGEVVWSQRDVAAVGGPAIADRMRPTYSGGYFDGGAVGSFTGGQRRQDEESKSIENAVYRGSLKGTKDGTKESGTETRRLRRLEQNISV